MILIWLCKWEWFSFEYMNENDSHLNNFHTISMVFLINPLLFKWYLSLFSLWDQYAQIWPLWPVWVLRNTTTTPRAWNRLLDPLEFNFGVWFHKKLVSPHRISSRFQFWTSSHKTGRRIFSHRWHRMQLLLVFLSSHSSGTVTQLLLVTHQVTG